MFRADSIICRAIFIRFGFVLVRGVIDALFGSTGFAAGLTAEFLGFSASLGVIDAILDSVAFAGLIDEGIIDEGVIDATVFTAVFAGAIDTRLTSSSATRLFLSA